MTVVELRGYALQARMGVPVRNSVGTIGVREALVVELVTDDGVSGWGETQGDVDAVWSALRDGPAAAALGADPLDDGAPRRFAAGRAPATAAEAAAISAIDIAFWDLAGRLLGRPIAALLPPAPREAVPAYASGPFLADGPDPYHRIADDASAIVAQGFRALKLRSGVNPAADRAALLRVRDAVGPDIALAIDINAGYDRRRAAELIDACADLGLRWIEEPLPADDADGYAGLARTTPLAAGETFWAAEQFSDAIERRTVDLLQPDLFQCGGITGALELHRRSAAAGIPMLPHVFGSGINLLASLQLVAALPAISGAGYPWLEFDRSDNPLRAIPAEPAVVDGLAVLPSGPGLGAPVERSALAPHVRWSETLRGSTPTRGTP